MRIGINLLCILPGVNGGLETYAVSLLQALAERNPSEEFVVFVNRQGSDLSVLDAPNIKPVTCNFDGRIREYRYAWEQTVLPRQVRKHRIDVLHSPGYQGPLHCPCPAVVTIPDLNFAFPGILTPYKRAVLSFFVSQSAKRATRVITISRFSKKEIVEKLGVPENKVVMIHLGPGICESSLDVTSRALPEQYIVAFAGGNYSHKNIRRLLEAFARIRNRSVSLLIIGRLSAELRACMPERAIELGFVESPEILPILKQARLCVIPSLYEGFGLPALEAQSAGVPLACSYAASLPEVAGLEAARFFNPEAIQDIAAAIDDVLDDPRYSDALIRAGRQNIKRFSWATTADQTFSIYQEVARLPVSAGIGAVV